MKIPAEDLVVLDKEWYALGRKAWTGLGSGNVIVGPGSQAVGVCESLRKLPREKQNCGI